MAASGLNEDVISDREEWELMDGKTAILVKAVNLKKY